MNRFTAQAALLGASICLLAIALSNCWYLAVPAVALPAAVDVQPASPSRPVSRLRESWPRERGKASVRVMTYNIHHGADVTGKLDLERIAQVIEDADADIVGLQEVDRNFGKRSDYQDQPVMLAERLKMHYVYGESLKVYNLGTGRGTGYYGNMILSRYPISDSSLVRLPTQWGNEPRTALKATVESPHGPMTVWVTHLGLSRGERQAQVGHLLARLEREPLPSIILGDFNANAHSSEILAMKECFGDVASLLRKDQQGTFYTGPNEPMPRIDYIWVDESFQPVEYQVITGWASDHLAATADLVVLSEGRGIRAQDGRGELVER